MFAASGFMGLVPTTGSPLATDSVAIDSCQLIFGRQSWHVLWLADWPTDSLLLCCDWSFKSSHNPLVCSLKIDPVGPPPCVVAVCVYSFSPLQHWSVRYLGEYTYIHSCSTAYISDSLTFVYSKCCRDVTYWYCCLVVVLYLCMFSKILIFFQFSDVCLLICLWT